MHKEDRLTPFTFCAVRCPFYALRHQSLNIKNIAIVCVNFVVNPVKVGCIELHGLLYDREVGLHDRLEGIRRLGGKSRERHS